MSTEQAQAELIEWIKKTAEEGQEFVVREAPLLAQEVVAWEFWIGFTIVATWFVAAIVLSTAAWLVYKSCCKNPEIGEPPQLPIATFTCCLLFIGLLPVVFEGIPRMVKSTVAPRLVIVEQLGRLFR